MAHIVMTMAIHHGHEDFSKRLRWILLLWTGLGRGHTSDSWRTAGEQLQRRHGATRDRSYIGLRNGVVRSWDLASQAQNRSPCEHHGFHRQIMQFMDSRDQNLEIILET